MATQSPFLLFEGFFNQIGARLQPPAWVVDEVQNRLVLLLNHVIGQEPEAMARLARQTGRVVRFAWRDVVVQLAATPAGLLERMPTTAAAELTLTLTQQSPFDLARAALQGEKPAVRIEGDVQLAAEVNWLADHVRWDIEEDVARLIGDAPAHTAGQIVRQALQALRQFAGARPTVADSPKAGA
jgi:ubiquinone biosynthesis accessory factor UbiJ